MKTESISLKPNAPPAPKGNSSCNGIKASHFGAQVVHCTRCDGQRHAHMKTNRPHSLSKRLSELHSGRILNRLCMNQHVGAGYSIHVCIPISCQPTCMIYVCVWISTSRRGHVALNITKIQHSSVQLDKHALTLNIEK